ncbi:DUF1003 domain-containing protein [Sphingorhabdus soli]|uniref:DUF1003 domain-containing protein n=1 Tax=Flavisphingopyxis soli TaxID=2601267 RepID=A0A5C6UP30_9SPHN|nr:DUF1003 domain-containing protein [Sphingorhabdus soli]TXC73876.1 DUF1003 domain-containing protein [Sphingorhabdus soli]
MTKRTVDELAMDLLGKTIGELEDEERKVVQRIHSHTAISEDVAEIADAEASFGERLSDRVAAVGGSWGFITVFGLVLVGWMVLNSEILGKVGMAFDPYPFIFLNLMLSTVAAIQAPIIMMSQNRASAKDRIAAAHDYEVNLRAELEIIRLHQKIDALLQIIEQNRKVDTK